MKVYCNILLLMILPNIVYSQEYSVSDNVPDSSFKKTSIRYNIYSNLGLGEFDKNINHSISVGFGTDYPLTSKLSIETGVLVSYKNLFYGQNYRLEIYCPTCGIVLINEHIKSTSVISFDIPIILSCKINPNKNTLVSFGLNNSYNTFFYQQIDKSYFSDKPLLYGKISRYDLAFLIGVSKDINKFNFGVYLYHNMNKLMKYDTLEDIENMNINDTKIFIEGLNPSYYKQLNFRIKYYF